MTYLSHLAIGLTHRITIDGYVLGIQGRWGSGKSTLANFVEKQINKASPSHQIIRFDPWLVGEKHALLSYLLGQLAAKIDEVERAAFGWWRLDYWLFVKLRKTLAQKIRKYGEYAAAIATPLGGVGAADPTGATALTAVGLKGAGLLKKIFDSSAQSMDQLKSSIVKELQKLRERYAEIRFTVIVDDTDRLEPAEAVEVLRVVRKVADFPLVTYVICFDENVLSHQVAVALNVANGKEYIEKIFQNVISLPPLEPFALRRYLRRLFTATFANEMRGVAAMGGGGDAGDVGYREHVLFDIWAGKLINTPRDVLRLYEMVKLGWTNMPRGADFLDFVWLQLVKLKAPSLHEWTQLYLTSIGAYRDGGRPGDAEPTQYADRLFKIMEELDWHRQGYHSGIGTILPGVDSFLLEYPLGPLQVLLSRIRLLQLTV
jgi:predicted KAP-like P-loop ATPase